MPNEITEIFAWILDENMEGEPAVPSVFIGGTLLPLYAQSLGIALEMKNFARAAAARDKTVARLKHFKLIQECEEYRIDEHAASTH